MSNQLTVIAHPLAVLEATVLLLITAGCRHRPPATPMISLDQLRSVVPLDELVPSEPPPQSQLGAPPPAVTPAEKPPGGPEQLRLTLAECRAETLANNLPLRVQLLNPTLAASRVTEEEARFEAAFFANANYVKTDTSPVSILDASQQETLNAEGGLRIPLRTGGEVRVSLPHTRTSTSDGLGSIAAPDGDILFSGLAPVDATYSTDLAVSVTQPLLRGGGRRVNSYAIEVARADQQLAEVRTKLEVMRVLALVDRAYWRLYAARQELGVRRQEYDLAMAHLQQARRRVKQGLSGEIEVLRAETGVAERLEGIILADTALRRGERELKRIINRPDLSLDSETLLVPVSEPEALPAVPEREPLVAAALTERAELLELELELIKDALTIDWARHETLPLVALSYTYRVNGRGASWDDAYARMGSKDYENHVVGLQVEVPLGNQAARSRLRQALLTRRQRLATREAREQTIIQEVHDALDQLQATWQRVRASAEARRLAERSLQAEERQFGLGLSTSTEVLDAQARFAASRLAEIRALTEHQIARVDAAYAVGMTLGEARIRWQPRQ